MIVTGGNPTTGGRIEPPVGPSAPSGASRPERADRPGDQPLPTLNDNPSIQSLVRADLDKREQVGIQRYGTPLQAHNGRDAMRDLYEELLDAATYARQVIEERDTTEPSRRLQDAETLAGLVGLTTGQRITSAQADEWLQGGPVGEPVALCQLDESNDMEAFAALPDCDSCGGTGKNVPEDFRGGDSDG